MMKHCIGSGRDCDRSTIIFLWLIEILDGGWNEGFKGSLGFVTGVMTTIIIQIRLF